MEVWKRIKKYLKTTHLFKNTKFKGTFVRSEDEDEEEDAGASDGEPPRKKPPNDKAQLK